ARPPSPGSPPGKKLEGARRRLGLQIEPASRAGYESITTEVLASPRSMEQQRRDVSQVPPPHPPVVGAFALDKRVLDARLLQRLVRGACTNHRGIVDAAANPQQLE